jgi:transcriptional regulator with XRE-family HTH domain
MTFGEKLRQYRENRGLTQTEVAEVLGLDQSSIAKYEGDAVFPNVIVGYRLAKLYGTTVEELATAKE